jgi:hypothetical protein
MNPLMAEQEFDKSITGKKVRQTGEFNQSIKINARISLNQSIKLFKQPQLTRLNPSKQGEREENKKRIIGGAAEVKPQGTTTVQQFVKTYKLFKKIQSEIDILEEYLTIKG